MMVRRLYLKFQLWRRGYCTKHLYDKHRGSPYSDHWWCPQCEAEKAAKRERGHREDKAKVERWREELERDVTRS